jgi:YbbR domain-containing protein
MPSSARDTLLNNLLWFIGSMALALVVWMVATLQNDPIRQERVQERIPVQMTADAGYLIISPSINNRAASVVVRAPSSVIALLSSDEIQIDADLTGLGTGEHVVELEASLDRQQATVVDIFPRVIRVTIEEAAQRQIPLRPRIIGEPPVGYAREEPIFDINLNQVLVSGPASRVSEAVAAEAELDLRQQRNPLEVDARLVAVDAEGNVISDVTLEPAVVNIQVPIRRRDDVREISVSPNIQGQPAEGYVLNALTYDPQTVLVSGLPTQLAALPDVISTEPIDLTGRTSSFEMSVPIPLPDDLLVLSGQTINVSIEVSAITTSRQFDAVEIEVIGLDDILIARIAPSQVTVLLTGAVADIDRLTNSDVRAVIDLNGYTPGNYTLAPNISITGPNLIVSENMSVLPAEIDVEIIDPNAPTPTPRAQG